MEPINGALVSRPRRYVDGIRVRQCDCGANIYDAVDGLVREADNKRPHTCQVLPPAEPTG